MERKLGELTPTEEFVAMLRVAGSKTLWEQGKNQGKCGKHGVNGAKTHRETMTHHDSNETQETVCFMSSENLAKAKTNARIDHERMMIYLLLSFVSSHLGGNKRS